MSPPRAAVPDAEASLDDLDALLDQLEHETGDIEEWVSYATARSELIQAGFGDLVGFCESTAPIAEQVPDIIERAVLTAVIDDLMAGDPRLSPVRSDERDSLVAAYQESDRSLIKNGAARVIDACNRRRPRVVVGEASVIQREATKKTRHRPIRQLMADAGRVAQDLRPCFMMSPLTVSQFLPGDMRFDVVIFDEASQVRPSDAVNAIYRGRQLIVAGDQRQLPPTSFFSRGTDDGDDIWAEDELEVFESVLDLCRGSGGMPSLPLQWHYRSRHESLITFSNREYYGGSLVTYPAATVEGPDVGLELFHIDGGRYQRGGARDNPVEARAVVERVLFHATNHPHLKVGVVAFSEAQATRISYELEAARRNNSVDDDWFDGDRLSGFFVKNLESVQGDERDIIIFSIGYGPDEAGKFTLQLGPLNKPGGERRLNVAVTRARQRVEIVSSITAADFPPDVPNAGVASLKRYLDFAERGMTALSVDSIDPSAEAESPFEEEVLDAIRGLGYRVQPQVGQGGYRIDIGVLHPEHTGRYLIGVECDGAAYHSSRVARDRDRLRQQVLEGLGWRLHRVWGPSWYRDRTGETAKLQRVLEAAERGELPAKWADAGLPVVIEVDLEPIDLSAPPDWAELYEPATFGYDYLGKRIDDPRHASSLQTIVRTIIDTEGPVSTSLVHERVRAAFGVQRNTATVRRAIDASLDTLQGRRDVKVTPDGFLYRSEDQLDQVRRGDPSIASSRRRVTDVGDWEIDEALRRTIGESGSIDHDELTDRVSRIFGWGRRGADITATLDARIHALETIDAIVRGPSGRFELAPLGPETGGS